MPFLVQIEQLHSPTVDCSRSTRMRNRTRLQWQPPSYVCSISLLLCCGAPGLRPIYGPDYYAALIIDPDGYRIEAYCGPAET